MQKVVALLFLIMFAIGTDAFLISPLLPTLQSLFGVPTRFSGWMMGSYALGYALFALVAGPLSDGRDRKRVMLAGMLGFSVATFACGFASGFWSMFLFRFLAGVCASFTAPQVWAAIPTLFPGPRAARALGIAFAGLAAAQVLGVPIGSRLATGHWSHSFFAVGGFSLVLALSIPLILPAMKPRAPQPASSSVWRRYGPLIRSGSARAAYLAYFLLQVGNFASFSFVGKWLTERFSLSLDQVGNLMIFLGIGTLVGSLSSASVFCAFPRVRTLTFGGLLLAFLFVLLPSLPSVTAIALVYLLISFLFYLIAPPIMESLISLHPDIRGTITSSAQATMYAAITLGSWAAGLLFAHFRGFGAVALLSAGCLAASLAIFIASGVVAPKRSAEKKSA
ncbi:MFS transporter [Cohnella zeiphila]|uniref:MFS transporter n=1 Tax=Cohnella zeiphila TaxID=2761120 RepID=A0A7X0SPE5_9BACL|nr:MFS transporter [Cohnella zeiphila]MBB6733571.1 MFS transporter [Cohnella zeiphila]